MKAGVVASVLGLAIGCCMPALGQAPVWPFDQPPIADLRASPKKVFAHYFTPFQLWYWYVPPGCHPAPVGCDDDGSYDYYQTYLSPHGESAKYLTTGGYLRERPLPAPYNPTNAADWDLRNMEEEVRRAIALGLDGFTLDLLAYDPNGNRGHAWTHAQLMMQAAANVDPGFKIVIMPDMSTGWTSMSNLMLATRTLAQHPSGSAYRVNDVHCNSGTAGCVVIAPYDAQSKPGAWWTLWKQLMEAIGIKVAFFPVFQPYEPQLGALKLYQQASYGFSDWATASLKYNHVPQLVNGAARVRAAGVPFWMQPVRTQDVRPKNTADPIFFENANSRAFRKGWSNAIEGGADWVQIGTWNDYSEHSEISPSTKTQYGFYDLTAYFTTWFKTGAAPRIVRDVIYYFHRTHNITAQPQAPGAKPFRIDASHADTAYDELEVLAFLASPAELRVRLGGEVDAFPGLGSGFHEKHVPLREGIAQFELWRNGERVRCFTSASRISNTFQYQDLIYHAGSSSRPHVSGASSTCS